MPIPTHGPFCQTWIYPVDCRDCGSGIHILQCTCGSCVLLDEVGWPWPEHQCPASSVGGTRGWVPATRVIPAGRPAPGVDGTIDTKKISPVDGQAMELLAVVRDVHSNTRRIRAIEALSHLGRQLLGLERTAYLQVTLVQNMSRPNESYTALVPSNLMKGIGLQMMVRATLSARTVGSISEWIVTDLGIL